MEENEYDFGPSDDEGNNVREPGTNQTWLGEGKHIVTVKSHELGEAGTGTPYIEIWIEDDDGRDHHERLSLHEKARWKLAQLFKAVGFTAKINLSQNGMVKRAVYNKRFQVTIGLGKPNERTGKAYREIKFFDPAPAGSSTRREEPANNCASNGRSERREERGGGYGGRSGGYGGGGGRGGDPREEAPPPDDDRIPF